MSDLRKKKTSKSLNHSISEISNSSKVNQCLFQNEHILTLENIDRCNPLFPHNKSQVSSSRKKSASKNVPNKENKNLNNSRSVKKTSHLEIEKIIDEKNILIATQDRQIESLKQGIDRLRRDFDLERVEFEGKKIDDLTMLKKYERQNQVQVKDLEKFQILMKELKVKAHQLELQKSNLAKKNQSLQEEIEQSQEENLRLKEKLFIKEEELNSQRAFEGQMKTMRDLKLQKNSLQERCNNFQKKVSQYIVKYNEVQAEFNDAQIKYFKVQKENDDLKISKEELTLENKNLKALLEEEKSLMMEQTEKWMGKLSKLEEAKAVEKNFSSLKMKDFFQQVDVKFTKLEKKQIIEQNEAEEEEKRFLENIIEEQKQEIMQLREKLNFSRIQIENLERQEVHKKDLIENLHKTIQINMESNEKLLKNIATEQSKGKQISTKAEELLAENQRIIEQHSQTIRNIKTQHQTQIQTLQATVSEFRTILNEKTSSFELEVENYQKSIETLKNEKIALSKKIQSMNEDKDCFYQQSELKIKNLQKFIALKDETYEGEFTQQNEKIREKQNMIKNVNLQLKDIKEIVGNSKVMIENLKSQLEQKQKELRNEVFMRTEEEKKYTQQITYYKKKYEYSFEEIKNLSEKICDIQIQQTEKVSQNSQLLKAISVLENENRVLKNSKQNSEKECHTYRRQIEQLHSQKEGEIGRFIRQIEELKKIKGKLSIQVEKERKEKEQKVILLQSQKQNIRREMETRIQLTRNQSFSNVANLKNQNNQVISKYREEITSLKQYNVRLSEHNEQLSTQLNSIIQQCTSAKEQCHQYRSSINQLQKDNNNLHVRAHELLVEMKNQKEVLNQEVIKYSQKLSSQQNNTKNIEFKMRTDIHEKANIILNLQAEIQRRNKKIEDLVQQIRRVKEEQQKIQKYQNDDSSRKQKEMIKEIESLKVEIRVVREENMNLQKIMDKELSKRKVIIEDLIKEKRILYQQLTGKS